jgi:hypothetical protein
MQEAKTNWACGWDGRTRNACGILVGESLGRHTVRKWIRKLEDNIKMDLGDKYKEIMNDCNYDVSCTLISLQFWA